ncbi:MAG: deoxynucleoside kinase [Deltaproteobacteria bacterium]|nr:deoxynucleoside kinase [Deltaproteobacteria bacterium]
MPKPDRKMFIAMAGNIGCGKTTAAKAISQTYGFELFDEPVVDNRFLKDYYADLTRWSFTLQLEFLIKRTQHHELIATVDKSCIQDRTLIEDPEVFAKYLHGLGHMNDKELDLYFDYFNRLNRDLKQPDKVVCLTVPDVDVLLRRIRQRGRAEEQGIDEDFLRGLNAYYSTFPKVCQRKYKLDVLTFDVSAVDIRSGDGRQRFLAAVDKFLSR